MHSAYWSALNSARQQDVRNRPIRRATIRRILSFARPHRRALVGFLTLSVFTAVLTVATPVLAGQVVDELTGADGDAGRWWPWRC